MELTAPTAIGSTVALGYILIAFGFIAGIVGETMFLVVAYKRSLFWFFRLPFCADSLLDFLFIEYEGDH